METATSAHRPRSTWIALACAFGALATALVGGLHAALGQPEVRPLPERLSETGLFSEGSAEIDPRNLPFTPQYPLWTDGAAKRRWVRLPEGAAIDARDPDAWVLPAGTRFWKEFSFGGRPVETRFFEKLADGSFRFATYLWAEDGRDAFLVPGGRARTVRVAGGQAHDVPSESDCRACHEGRPGRALGFSALQLSSDRDPNAPHHEPLPEGAIDLRGLAARGLIEGLPESVLRTPPRIAAKSPRERAALGYLYGNCSGCHNTTSPIASLGLDLDYSVLADQPAALRTTLDVPSAFAIPNASEPTRRIAPGHSEASAIAYRMSSRLPATQMPPLGTRVVDDEALELVRAWISTDLSTDLAEVKAERERQ